MDQSSYESLLQTAFEELEKVHGYSREENMEYMKKNGPFPPNLPTGEGQFFFTTKSGYEAVGKLGTKWRCESADRQRRLTEERGRRLAVSAMGEALAGNLWSLRSNPAAAWKALRSRMETRLAQLSLDASHSFPCQIFRETAVGQFTIGPVTFLPRMAWLDQLSIPEGNRSEWVEAVRRVWLGETVLPTDDSLKSLDVRTIVRTFNCPWVAKVNVEGNDFERSKERARIAVRLAIDALGLVLGCQNALSLRAPGDRLARSDESTFSQSGTGHLALGESMDLPGLDFTPEGARQFVTATTKYRAAAGKAIASFVAVAPADKPELFQRWCDALYWFGDARRDSEGFMSLTRCGMSLDILAKGGKAPGILALLSALMDIDENAAFLKDGTTLGNVVKRIYNQGRSQFGHGGRAALLEDLPFSRLGADTIGALVLERYIRCLETYSGPDRYEDFIAAIPNLLPNVTK